MLETIKHHMAEWVFVFDADDDDAEDNIEDEKTSPVGMHLCLCLNPFCKSWLPAFVWLIKLMMKMILGPDSEERRIPEWYQCRSGPSCPRVHRLSCSAAQLDLPMPRRILNFPVPEDEIGHNWYWLWGNPQFNKVSSSSPQSPKSPSTILLISFHIITILKMFTSGAQAGISPPTFMPGTPSRPPAMIIVGVLMK